MQEERRKSAPNAKPPIAAADHQIIDSTPRPTGLWPAVPSGTRSVMTNPSQTVLTTLRCKSPSTGLRKPMRKWSILIPDGITDVTKSERTGCYPDAFARVLAVKEEWDADRAVREQKSWDDAQAAKDALRQTEGGRTGGTHSPAGRRSCSTCSGAGRAVCPNRCHPRCGDTTADSGGGGIRRTSHPCAGALIIEALRSYTGPITKNGQPKRMALNDTRWLHD